MRKRDLQGQPLSRSCGEDRAGSIAAPAPQRTGYQDGVSILSVIKKALRNNALNQLSGSSRGSRINQTLTIGSPVASFGIFRWGHIRGHFTPETQASRQEPVSVCGYSFHLRSE